jgi:hypothetical protein
MLRYEMVGYAFQHNFGLNTFKIYLVVTFYSKSDWLTEPANFKKAKSVFLLFIWKNVCLDLEDC